MRTKHDGDCTIFSAMCNDRPEDGICTCGFGRVFLYEHDGNIDMMYSEERLESLLLKQENDRRENKNSVE